MNRNFYVLMDQSGGDGGASGGQASAAVGGNDNGNNSNGGGGTTVVTPAANGSAAAPAAGFEWLGKDVPELDVGYVTNKGWKAPTDILAAYKGAEKFISAPVDQRLVMPGDKATPEEVKAFWGKLGTPAEAKDYKIAVPAGDDGAFAKQAAEWFHGANLTQKQAEAVTTKWNEHVANMAATQATQKAQAFAADDAKLKVEWGAAHDKNVFIAKEVVGKLGLDAKTIDKMEASLGHHGTMTLLAKIGAGLGEDGFVGGRTENTFGDALTPAAAKSQIETLKQDKAFVASYLKGDATAKAKMAELHKYAYPDQQ